MNLSKQVFFGIDCDTLYDDIILKIPPTEISPARRKKLVRRTYETTIPRILDWLDEMRVVATFFVIGHDAHLCPDVVRLIYQRGHEIGNHSHNHLKNLTQLPDKEILLEVNSCQKIVEDILGKRPISFKAPGYTLSPKLLCILYKCGIRIDTSMVTSILYQVIKYILKQIMSNKESLILQEIGVITAPNKPYNIDFERIFHSREDNCMGLIEFPISNSSFLPFPLISGLLLNLPNFARRIVVKSAIRARYLNINLHPHEFIVEKDDWCDTAPHAICLAALAVE